MSNQRKSMLFGLIAVVLWSTVATAFSLSLSYLSPIQLLSVAATVSFLCLSSLVVYKGQTRQLLSVAKTSYLSSFVFGAINPFIYYLVLLEAYRLLPAQEAQAINYTWAIMLSFMAVPLLKQRLSLADVVAAIACYFGVLIIATQGEPASLQFSHFTGVAFALLSTIIWAVYWLLNTKDSRPDLIGLTLNFACSLPLIFCYYWLTSGAEDWPVKGVLGAIYIGLFEMGITFVLWNSALKLTNKASKVANLIFISPILSIVWISQLTDEAIRAYTLVGLGFILLGLFVQNWIKEKK